MTWMFKSKTKAKAKAKAKTKTKTKAKAKAKTKTKTKAKASDVKASAKTSGRITNVNRYNTISWRPAKIFNILFVNLISKANENISLCIWKNIRNYNRNRLSVKM